ncbi:MULTISPECIES: MurR/RpiR family transcriptional regulator [Helcococcus]|uniref:MurR/RpiR family transcriptional regulator n=1 Tax=Helcococcus bovis TaxID=3153252 RepID=A0ABW9F5Y6_9FIRM
MNKSYNFIKNLISKNSIKLSHLEQEFLDRLGESNIEIFDSYISELSKAFYVSNSTITRFAKKLGFDGFNELKFALQNIQEPEKYQTQKIYTSVINDIKEFDKDIVELIHNLDKFHRIVIVGIGSSGLIANEMMFKLGEIGLNNLDYAKEPYGINILSNNLSENDLLICISLSGENTHILEACENAKNHNATIFSISGNVNSSLKNYSDYLLKTPGYSTYEYSISKMLPILIYIDIICEIYTKRV